MIRFLVGRTGCGKTYTVTQEIKALMAQKKENVFLFVPEQQHFSAERELYAGLSTDDAKRLSILSFTRLCDVMEDTYGGRAMTHISKATSALLMWQNLRMLNGLLQTYGGNCQTDISLTKKMLETVNELSSNGITTPQLEKVCQGLEKQSPLYAKLKDISMISSTYGLLLQDICGSNPSDRMLRCANAVKEHDFFKGASIYIDSFTSFTMQEYAVLEQMFTQANEVVITLSMDAPMGHEPQFESVRDTYEKLFAMANHQNLSCKTELLTTQHRIAPKELLCLEASLWDFTAKPYGENIPAEERGHIHLLTAPTPYDEAEAVALHILEMEQQGIALGDMAIVVRDASQWKGILDAVLEQYHIPYFLSERTDLNTKPAARLLLLALRCISRGWQREDILSLCKTGLCNIDPRDLDYFEEYVHTWRISGKRMTEAWSMNPDGYTTHLSARGERILEAANRIRETIMTPLLELDISLKASKTPTEQCKAIYTYLNRLSVKQQLASHAEMLVGIGRIREAEENVRLWSFLTETLATISSTLPEDALPLRTEELAQVLSLIFAETDIGSVPARHDCVTIGSANILRVDHIAVSFVMGLCEGEFPSGAHTTGLLSEQDRGILKDNGIILDAREEKMMAEELLYVYRAMTKPTAHLYLSHSLSQIDGQKLSPSAAFGRITYLFPYIDVLDYQPHYIHTSTASAYTPPTQERIAPIQVREILGDRIWLSQSKIQRYAHCPYSYFGTHILKLRPQKQATWDNNTSGTFLHHVMEHFLRNSLDENGKILPLDEKQIQETADQIILAYIEDICGDIELNGRLQHTFARLRAIALVLLYSIVNELKQSTFSPVGFEWDTHGFKPTDPSPLVLPLAEYPDAVVDDPLPTGIHQSQPIQLMLGGVVDRVDVYRSDDGKRAYIRVIDYKSSKHDFSQRSLTEDMDIQLLLYLFTLCSPNNRKFFADKDGNIPEAVLPAQAMYISPQEDNNKGKITPLRTGMILHDLEILRAASQNIDTEFLPTGISRDKNGDLKGKALYSQDEVADLESILHQVVLEQASAMYGGDAKRTPTPQGCNYCSLRDGCPVAAEKPSYNS